MAVVVEVGPGGEEAATWTTARGSSTNWVGWVVKRCEAGVKDCVSPGFCAVTGCGWSDRGRVAGWSSVGGVLRTTFLLTGLSGTDSSMVDDGEKKCAVSKNRVL